MDYLGGSFRVLDEFWDIASSRISVTHAADEEVRSWLRALPVDAESVVRVDWARDGIGVEVPFFVFVRYFDDFWYPSSDDVVVMFPDGAILFLDHEERFSYVDYRRFDKRLLAL
ncbi:hypothetical protein AB0M02_02315 [Actinoplanes sp. NPDC051861]|uniref:hypothetical protein n=1 Tax=Actinoplanes sp. NPDC051861 TaxID=3155170 RepID=UPI00343E4C9A